MALGVLWLFPLEAAGDGAAGHAVPALTALPLPAVAAFLRCYGRGAVPRLARMARTGLTVQVAVAVSMRGKVAP